MASADGFAENLPDDPAHGDAYALFQRGRSLAEGQHWAQAIISLEKARDLEPDKTSIREMLGRAYFRTGRFPQAAEEFAAVVDRAPDNDYAHFCLARSCQQLGDARRAARHFALAAAMRPERNDYRDYRDRTR